MPGKQNRHYHDFFEGYTEEYVVRPDGSRRIRRVYTGKLYEQDGSRRRKVLTRCAYTAAFLLSAAAFLLAATTVSPGNLSRISAIPTLAAVLLYLWAAVALIYSYSMRPRTVYEHRTAHDGLLRASLGLAVCHGLGILVRLVLMVVDHSLSSAPEYHVLGCLALSAGLMLAVHRAERRCVYREYDAGAEGAPAQSPEADAPGGEGCRGHRCGAGGGPGGEGGECHGHRGCGHGHP